MNTGSALGRENSRFSPVSNSSVLLRAIQRRKRCPLKGDTTEKTQLHLGSLASQWQNAFCLVGKNGLTIARISKDVPPEWVRLLCTGLSEHWFYIQQRQKQVSSSVNGWALQVVDSKGKSYTTPTLRTKTLFLDLSIGVKEKKLLFLNKVAHLRLEKGKR